MKICRKKKIRFKKEIEQETRNAEKEIQKFKSESLDKVNTISEEIVSNLIKDIFGEDLNKNSIKATVSQALKEHKVKKMNIDATFWVAVSFLIFVGLIFYLKVPQKIGQSLERKHKKLKEEIDNAEKLKDEAKNILSEYESKVSKSKEEIKNLISESRKTSRK